VYGESNTKNEMATFEEWLDTINAILMDAHGVEIADLADEPFVDYYDDGLEPHDVVDIMVNGVLGFL
jgi:hypothetical protein